MTDAVTYSINYSLTATGPWTKAPGSPFSGLSDTISGLTPATPYFFQITTNDVVLNISSTPIVVGPVSTSSSITESPQGAFVSPSGGNIIDLPLNTWTLQTSTSSGFQVYQNGVLSPTTSNIVLIVYWNSTVFTKNSTNVWSFWNSVGWSPATGDPRLVPSLNGTIVNNNSKSIIDTSLTTWTLSVSLVNGFQATRNGVVDTTTNNLTELLYYNSVVYKENSQSVWASWNGSAWIAATNPLIGGSAPSPNGTIVTTTTTSITDTLLNVWKLATSVASGLQIVKNGVVDTTLINLTTLLYWNGLVYMQNSTATWRYWNGNKYVQVTGDPRSSVITLNPFDASPTIVLSNTNLTAASVSAVSQSVRSQVGYSAGSFFFEFRIDNFTKDFCVGIASSAYNLASSTRLGGDPTSIGFFPISPPQGIFVGSTLGPRVGVGVTVPGTVSNVVLQTSSDPLSLTLTWTPAQLVTTGGDVNGNIISCAVDFTHQLIWFTSPAMRASGHTWNNVTGADPVTGVGGITFNIGTGPFYVAFNDDIGGAQATVNFGASAFNQPLPTGFAAWSTSASTAAVLNTPTTLLGS